MIFKMGRLSEVPEGGTTVYGNLCLNRECPKFTSWGDRIFLGGTTFLSRTRRGAKIFLSVVRGHDKF